LVNAALELGSVVVATFRFQGHKSDFASIGRKVHVCDGIASKPTPEYRLGRNRRV
jgi:hypothetical protein